MIIPFHKPVVPDNINEVFPPTIKDGWLTTGPQVKKFEDKLRGQLNSEECIAVNSCTAALHLALAAMNFGKGDKFIAPTYTFVSSVEVGEYLGMFPLLMDCDEDFNIDLNQIEDSIKTDKSIKCIIPVHFAGKPVDMNSIFSIADKYGLFVLEDAAHALESKSNYGKVGYTKFATAFSFYANKNITTWGEGGAVTTNDFELSERIRKLSLHGMSKDGWKRFKTGGKWMYDVSNLGYKYNMTDVSASFGLWQLNHVEKWHKRREEIFYLYNKKLSEISGLITPAECLEGEVNAFHLYIIKIKTLLWKIDRNQIIKMLNKSGIGTSVHYKPVHMHSYYISKYGYKQNDFPNSKKYYNCVITLPLYPLLKNEQIDYIIDCILDLWGNYKV
jgi:dTDP-4-amino-4,6-dideoxygalactose transaminase